MEQQTAYTPEQVAAYQAYDRALYDYEECLVDGFFVRKPIAPAGYSAYRVATDMEIAQEMEMEAAAAAPPQAQRLIDDPRLTITPSLIGGTVYEFCGRTLVVTPGTGTQPDTLWEHAGRKYSPLLRNDLEAIISAELAAAPLNGLVAHGTMID